MLPHASCYCEENAYLALRALGGDARERHAVFCTSDARQTVFWGHRRGGSAVIWDYHVFVVERRDDGGWYVLDHDADVCRLSEGDSDGCRSVAWVPFGAYERACLAPPDDDAWRELAAARRFRPVRAADLLQRFASDRGHMRLPDGGWSAPPPPWPAIGASPPRARPLTLSDLLASGPDYEADGAWRGQLLG